MTNPGHPGVMNARHLGVMNTRRPGVMNTRHPGVMNTRHPGVFLAGVQDKRLRILSSQFMDTRHEHPLSAFIPAHKSEAIRDAPPAREFFAPEDRRRSSPGERARE
jgi:hypothetical protein